MDNLFNHSQPALQPTALLAVFYREVWTYDRIWTTENPHPDPEIVRLLLEKGADPNCVDEVGFSSPIVYGVISGRIEIVDLLLKHGAALHREGFVDNDALLIAARQGRTEMIRYLLSHGADSEVRGAYGETPLIRSVRYAPTPVAVRLLLGSGAKVNTRDRSGKTALFYAKNPSRSLAPEQSRLLPAVIAELSKSGAK